MHVVRAKVVYSSLQSLDFSTEVEALPKFFHWASLRIQFSKLN